MTPVQALPRGAHGPVGEQPQASVGSRGSSRSPEQTLTCSSQAGGAPREMAWQLGLDTGQGIQKPREWRSG